MWHVVTCSHVHVACSYMHVVCSGQAIQREGMSFIPANILLLQALTSACWELLCVIKTATTQQPDTHVAVMLGTLSTAMDSPAMVNACQVVKSNTLHY